MALGLTQCKGTSSQISVAPAVQNEQIKPEIAPAAAAGWRTAIAQVAQKNIPAVVHIDVTQRREIANPMLPFSNDPFFHFFFNGQQPPQKFKQELKGLGTGMLIDNSGGPLINLSGQVVGVNAAIATESGGFEGIGFAIPSNMAVHVATALIDHGEVIRGWLGVNISDLTPAQVKSMKRKGRQGAFIAEVVPNSPADAAGLKKGDLVLKYQ